MVILGVKIYLKHILNTNFKQRLGGILVILETTAYVVIQI